MRADDAARDAVASAAEGRLRALWARQPVVDLGAIEGRAIALPLEDVYVPLRVIEGAPEGEALDIEELRALAQLAMTEGPDQTASRRVDEARLRRLLGRASRPLDVLLAGTASFVLLGDPGAGKSSALRHHLHSELMRPGGRLPVFVQLAGCDEILEGQSGAGEADLLSVLGMVLARRCGSGAGDLLRTAMDQGRLLLLLDGLDEVLRRDTRTWLAERTGELIALADAAGSQVIVTSRYIGYREAPVLGVPEFTIAPLTVGDVERFADRFYSRLAVSLGEDVGCARLHRDALLADIRARSEVRDLAAVPYQLTQLAVLRRELGSLPDSRADLYDRMLTRLLRDWPHKRSRGARLRQPAAPEVLRTRGALVKLAFELHQRPAAGTTPEEVVLHILGDALRDGHGPPAKAEATQMLEEMRRRAGLLVERAPGSYGFVHLTMEEFLAGQALAGMGAADAMGFLKERLHDARWHQPLLWAVAWLGRSVDGSRVAGDLIQRVRDAGSAHEGLLHRDLLLAADLAAEPGDFGPARDALMQRVGGPEDPDSPKDASLADLLGSPIRTLRWEAVRRMALLTREGGGAAERALLGWLEKTRDFTTAEAMIPVLHTPGCKRVREMVWARLNEVDDWHLARILVWSDPLNEVDLARVIQWARRDHDRMAMTHMVWIALGQKVAESAVVREAVRDELRRKNGELVLPPAPALRDDPELSWEVFQRWAEQGRHGDEALARELGLMFVARGIDVAEVLEPVRRHWNTSANVLPALEAYSREPSVREFLWSVAQDDNGYPNQVALMVLAPCADDAEIDRMLAGYAKAGADGLAPWVAALLLVPRRDRVTSALDEVLVGEHEPARTHVIRARLSRASDDELITWFKRETHSLRDVILPELGRRTRPAATAALREGLTRGERDGEAHGWAWGPLAVLYGEHEGVRARLNQAVEAGDQRASRAMALQPDAPAELRARALGNLNWLVIETLFEGGSELIEIAAGSDHGPKLLERACKWPSLLHGMVRGELARAMFPRLGADALMQLAGDQALHVLGDLYELLPEGGKSAVNRLWTTPELWYSKAPPADVPVVQAMILGSILNGSCSLLQWAPLFGADLHQVEGATDAIRAACAHEDRQLRAKALTCLGGLEELSPADLAILVERFEKDRDLSARREAVRALVRHCPLEEVAPVLRRHLTDPDATVRHWCAAGLAVSDELRPDEHLDWLGVQSRFGSGWGLNQTDSETLRQVIALSLARHLGADPALRQRVLDLLKAESWSLRQGAAYALAFAEGEPPIDGLLAGLQDHRGAEISLTQTGCATALLVSSDAEDREAAVKLLCRGLRYGVEPWLDSLDSEVLRQHCASRLGTADLLTRHPAVLTALHDTLNDSSESVRSAAWIALRRVLTAPTSLDQP